MLLTFDHLTRFDYDRVSVVNEYVEAERLYETTLEGHNLVAVLAQLLVSRESRVRVQQQTTTNID